jgi:hypothetical protein
LTSFHEQHESAAKARPNLARTSSTHTQSEQDESCVRVEDDLDHLKIAADRQQGRLPDTSQQFESLRVIPGFQRRSTRRANSTI